MKIFETSILALLMATASVLAISNAHAQQDYVPSQGQVPYQGPMGQGSAGGGQQFLPTTVPGGYTQQGVQGYGEQQAYVQTSGTAGCGLDRNVNTRLVNRGGSAVLAPQGSH